MTAQTNYPIDIIRLYATSNHQEWNTWLAKCERTQDINGLTEVRRRLQQGMAEVEKKKLNTEKIAEFFVRLQRSIDITIKKIYRAKNPNPLYDTTNKHLKNKFIEEKKRVNLSLEKELKKVNY